MADLNKSQLEAVASWFAAGASLDEIQKRLRAEFDVHMTYLDLRLLVADLPQPSEPEPEPVKAPPPPKPSAMPPPPPLGAAGSEAAAPEPPAYGPRVANAAQPKRYDLDAPDADQGVGQPDVVVEMDALMIPGTLASGDVTFSDGTKGKWYVDRQGRLGLGNCPEGYNPPAADVQIFQSRLMELLQSRGIC